MKLNIFFKKILMCYCILCKFDCTEPQVFFALSCSQNLNSNSSGLEIQVQERVSFHLVFPCLMESCKCVSVHLCSSVTAFEPLIAWNYEAGFLRVSLKQMPRHSTETINLIGVVTVPDTFLLGLLNKLTRKHKSVGNHNPDISYF